MYTNPDAQFTAIIQYILFSIFSKILGNCLKQKTDFTHQKTKMKTVQFLEFLNFTNYPYEPLCTL